MLKAASANVLQQNNFSFYSCFFSPSLPSLLFFSSSFLSPFGNIRNPGQRARQRESEGKKIFKNNHNKKKLPPHEQKEKGPSRSRLYVPLRKTKGRYRGRQRRILGAATFATQKVEEEETQGGLETPLCFCLLC